MFRRANSNESGAQASEEQPNSQPNHTAQNNLLKTDLVIPYNSTTNALLHQINPHNLPDPNEVCTFCQEELSSHNDSRLIVETLCGHHFCSQCINGYLTHQILNSENGLPKYKCPNCNRLWKIIWDPEGPSLPEREPHPGLGYRQQEVLLRYMNERGEEIVVRYWPVIGYLDDRLMEDDDDDEDGGQDDEAQQPPPDDASDYFPPPVFF